MAMGHSAMGNMQVGIHHRTHQPCNIPEGAAARLRVRVAEPTMLVITSKRPRVQVLIPEVMIDSQEQCMLCFLIVITSMVRRLLSDFR